MGGGKGGGAPDITQYLNQADQGLDFTNMAGAYGAGGRVIEGMSTQAIPRNPSAIDSTSQKIFDLNQVSMDQGFAKTRSKLSEALSGRRLGRTSSFADAMGQNAADENAQKASLFANILQGERTDSFSRDSLAANMEMAGLQSRTSRYGQKLAIGQSAMQAGAQKDSAKSSGVGQAVGTVAGARLMMSEPTTKENIEELDFDPTMAAHLPVYEFEYKPEYQHIEQRKGKQIGFMADEVEKLLPHAIEVIDGIRHVNLIKIVPVLWGMIHGQQKEIERLKTLVEG